MEGGNPYAQLLTLLRQEAKGQLPRGHVRGEVSRESPLQIKIGTIPIEAEELEINRTLRGSLEPGDQVLLLAQDDMQHFIVLCKVVGA